MAPAVPPGAAAAGGRSEAARPVRRVLAAAAGVAAAAGFAAWAYTRLERSWRERRRARDALEQLERWTAEGPALEPTVDIEVPVEHGATGEDVDYDVVEVPVGLLFECERIRAALFAHLKLASDGDDESALVEALQPVLGRDALAVTGEDPEASAAACGQAVPRLPWLDLAALAQLTYWYDRRPSGEKEAETTQKVAEEIREEREVRLSDAKYGRWTKKVSREKVVYGTVALRYRTRGHLGQQVFRRPAGVDVTRLSTLQRAAALCGHGPLLGLVEETMERLRPKNVVRIPWSEVEKHTSKDDLWLLIDGKVYDVSPFLDLHPGGGQLIVEAAGKDATSLFERTHGEGLRYSLRLLNQFFIGMCENPEEAEKAEPGVPTPEFLATLQSITGALHTFDEAKATGEAQGMLR